LFRPCFVEILNAFHQTVDSKGLITADRKGLQEHKKCGYLITYQLLIEPKITMFISFRSHGLPGPSVDWFDRHNSIRQAHRLVGS
jgi:hypothetical protein